MLDFALVNRVQNALIGLGYHIVADGDFGPKTLNAVAAHLKLLDEPLDAPGESVKALAWGKKVDAAFRKEVIRMSDIFGWSSPDMLMTIMAFETGETFSPSVKNMAGSGATGLIQFMPTTARSLGTTVEALARMTALEQLAYVRKYFALYGSKVVGPSVTLADLYMAVLMPKFIDSADSAVLFTGGTVAYRQNSGLDANTDGKITKGEVAAIVYAKLTRGKSIANLYTE